MHCNVQIAMSLLILLHNFVYDILSDNKKLLIQNIIVTKTNCNITMDVPSNIITHCDVTLGISSNVITHYDVIMSHGI